MLGALAGAAMGAAGGGGGGGGDPPPPPPKAGGMAPINVIDNSRGGLFGGGSQLGGQ